MKKTVLVVTIWYFVVYSLTNIGPVITQIGPFATQSACEHYRANFQGVIAPTVACFSTTAKQ